MGANNIIVKEYLESLKEDKELDHLFPILLDLMGFKVVATPTSSKGQPQYGKDVVAKGKDHDGQKKRFYFELKGFQDKDIDDQVLNKKDGIIESLRASKNTPFSDSSIPGFNSLPEKFVLVHNGELKANTKPTFEGFIKQEFPEGNFERWDINELTKLFSEHLFSEYLFADNESLRLFKKTLVLLESPHYDFNDFKALIDLQISKIGYSGKSRSFKKFFATQNLIAFIILHYSRENNNLEPAKKCITYLLLKTWAWVLRNGLEKKESVKKEVRKLIHLHYKMLEEYFEKTLPIAFLENGLFAENGGPFEKVGYPLRSFEFINYLIYFYEARLYYPTFYKESENTKKYKLRRKQKDALIKIIQNNEAFKRPLLDNHSIPILNIALFLIEKEDLAEKDLEFLVKYLYSVLENLKIIYYKKGRLPELHNSEEALVESEVLQEKTEEYEDSSSLLITILFEIAVLINFEQIHKDFSEFFQELVNLQTAYPKSKDFDIEQLLFEKNLDEEMYPEVSIDLKSSLLEFKSHLLQKNNEPYDYRTDNAGFPFLRTLAHIYFKNEFFPSEWRVLLRNKQNES